MDFQIIAEFKNQADKYTVQTELNNMITHLPTLDHSAMTPTSCSCRAIRNLIETQIIKINFRKKYRRNKLSNHGKDFRETSQGIPEHCGKNIDRFELGIV